MTFTMLYSKIHRAKITDANLNYIGSITIDKELCNAAGLKEGMQVDVVNINNGARFSTYVIYGESNSGNICLNGAAARLACIDDLVIIIAYAQMSETELNNYTPKVIQVDSNNRILNTHKDLHV